MRSCEKNRMRLQQPDANAQNKGRERLRVCTYERQKAADCQAYLEV
jgi:hypothetical protein